MTIPTKRNFISYYLLEENDGYLLLLYLSIYLFCYLDRKRLLLVEENQSTIDNLIILKD